MCVPIHEPSKGRPCLFCRGANSRTLGQSALPLVSPPCGLLPAKRERHSFLRVIPEMPVEGDFASPRPSLASLVPAFLVIPGMTGGGVIGEHGFLSPGKSDGVFQVLPQTREKQLCYGTHLFPRRSDLCKRLKAWGRFYLYFFGKQQVQ